LGSNQGELLRAASSRSARAIVLRCDTKNKEPERHRRTENGNDTQDEDTGAETDFRSGLQLQITNPAAHSPHSLNG
jgi:hypothetical protein